MPKHDPVSAIAEDEATGETAAIFADIRNTMQIPLLTSIWRILAGVEDGLSATWNAAKPIFETGHAYASFHKMKSNILLPVPEPLTADLLGLKPEHIMMVAAHNSDLIAAKAVGFSSAFVYRTEEYGPDQKSDLEPHASVDLIAKGFIDLAKQLTP